MSTLHFKPTVSFEGIPELEKAFARLQGTTVDDALAAGFRATGRAFPGYMAQGMAKFYTPGSQVLKGMIQRPYITGGRTPELNIKTSVKPISARHFKPLNGIRHQNRKNASIAVFKGQRTTRQNGFRNLSSSISTMAQGTPFVRKGSRLPIEKFNTVSFHHAFTGGAKARPILNVVEDKAKHKLEQSVIRALRSKARGLID